MIGFSEFLRKHIIKVRIEKNNVSLHTFQKWGEKREESIQSQISETAKDSEWRLTIELGGTT